MDNMFLYGEFNNESILQKVIGRVPVGESAKLNGYRLRDDFVFEGEMHSGVEETSEFSVDGALYAMFPEELSLFDQYMFDNYKRERVMLDSGASSFTYIPKHKD